MGWTQQRHPQEPSPRHIPFHPNPPSPIIPSPANPGGAGILSNAASLIYNSVLRWHPRVEITHVDNGGTACSNRGKGHHLDAAALFLSLSKAVLTSRVHPIQ